MADGDNAVAPWTEVVHRWHRARPGQVRDRCFLVCHVLAAKFPELRIVHGVGAPRRLVAWTKEQWKAATMHCWLVDPSGGIVDPTCHQYGPRGGWLHPLRNGLLWKRGAKADICCPRCGNILPEGYAGPPCCEFECGAWMRHIVQLEAPVRAERWGVGRG